TRTGGMVTAVTRRPNDKKNRGASHPNKGSPRRQPPLGSRRIHLAEEGFRTPADAQRGELNAAEHETGRARPNFRIQVGGGAATAGGGRSTTGGFDEARQINFQIRIAARPFPWRHSSFDDDSGIRRLASGRLMD